MDKVKFFKDQYCGGRLIHKANTEYECMDETEKHYFIRQEKRPDSKNPCTRFPKSCEGNLFTFIDPV